MKACVEEMVYKPVLVKTHSNNLQTETLANVGVWRLFFLAVTIDTHCRVKIYM